jgi:hypothetical protein
MEIITEGYYVSDGMCYEDATASGTEKGYIFHFLKFYPDGTYLMVTENNMDFDFLSFIKNLPEEKKKGYVHGTYSVIEHIIKFHNIIEALNSSSDYEYTILSPKILLDKDLREFRHVIPNETVKKDTIINMIF